MIIVADTSAVGSLYLVDERDGSWMTQRILNSGDDVMVSELVDVEVASLLARAWHDGRIDDARVNRTILAYQDHTADDGPIGVLPLHSGVITRAAKIVQRVATRTLDALHLGTAQLLAHDRDEEVYFLTLDSRQAEAATALGIPLVVRPESS